MTNDLLQQSREKQSKFIKQIADRLGRPTIQEKPDHPFKGAPAYWKKFELPSKERVTLFSDNWRNAGGDVVHTSSMDEAKSWIVKKTMELKAKRLLYQSQPELERLELEVLLPDVEVEAWNAMPRENRMLTSAGADIGLIVVDHAVAYTGSIVVTSAEQKGRSVSLLPAVLFAIVPAGRLYTRLGEVLHTLDAAPREELPAGIHFISGPSRSADIENDLTIGVHGPGIVYAILVN